MADHKAEIILEKIKNILSNLETTGDSVERSRVYPWTHDSLPALNVLMGGDVPVDQEALSLRPVDWYLTVNVEAVTKVFPYAYIDTELNLIRAEVSAAIMKDYTLGLDFVLEVRELGSNEPETTGDGDKPAAKQLTGFVVKYRRSYNDPRV